MMNRPNILPLSSLLITLYHKYTEHELETFVEVLNPNKANCYGAINPKMLKGASKSVSKHLCILMNRSFDKSFLFCYMHGSL